MTKANQDDEESSTLKTTSSDIATKTPTISSSPQNEDLEKQNQQPEASKVPKIEIIDDDEDDEEDDEKNLKDSSDNSENLPKDKLINLIQEKSNINNNDDEATSNFKQNVERFGSLLGEELVNSYWRRGLPQHPHHHHQQLHHQHPQHQHHSMMMPQTVQTSQQQYHQHLHHQQQQQQPTNSSSSSSSSSSTSSSLLHHQQASSVPQPPPPPPPCGPSTTTLLSQLVNSTFSNPNSTSSQNSSLRSTDAHFPHHHHHHHQLHQHHQMPPHLADHLEKSAAMNHHESSASSNSTPNLPEHQRSVEDHQQALQNHHSISLNGSMKNFEDNNNSMGSTPSGHGMGPGGHPHLPHGFLPGLPFQFQERGHFRFADDLQLPPGTSMAGRLGESLIPKGDPMEAKLQEMLRYNMDKYANQALDTLHISRRVRELLSVHNIGQRIFAKYILGLSQGTVSELLSKPKPWDKLTEKGRDSYRKMHAWSCDDNAVMLLKSLIPKKGKFLGNVKKIFTNFI